MNNQKYQKLHSMICEAINQLELLIKNNKNMDHTNRYDALLNYLNYCKERSAREEIFEFEVSNFGLELSNYLDGSIDPKEFYEIICKIDRYFLNEFILNANNEKYIKLNEMLCHLSAQLEEIIKSNKNTEHAIRYDMFLKYLNYCQEKAVKEDSFDLEIGNLNLGLFKYLDESVDPEDFFSNVCMVNKYFFDEFVLR